MPPTPGQAGCVLAACGLSGHPPQPLSYSPASGLGRPPQSQGNVAWRVPGSGGAAGAGAHDRPWDPQWVKEQQPIVLCLGLGKCQWVLSRNGGRATESPQGWQGPSGPPRCCWWSGQMQLPTLGGPMPALRTGIPARKIPTYDGQCLP